MRRTIPFLFLLFGCVALVSSSASAQAPVSDADREAARDLYKEGYELRRAARYPEALDRFRRSQQVYPAPTALLHIAECEAQLLHLVEAAETYRALAREQLPANASPAFLAAQTQGAAELQQIEPRIPHVQVEVKPPNAPNLVVMIDDKQMNGALLGVTRPVNPGQHTIVASASGYDRTEVVVSVQEKEPPKVVALDLKATPAAIAPEPSVAVTPASPPQVIVVGPPPVYVPPAYVRAPSYYVRPPPPFGSASRTGIFMGLRLGGIVPEGDRELTNLVGTGLSIGAEFNFRFARRFFFGAILEHGFLSTSNAAVGANGGNSPTFTTTNFDVVFGVVPNPDHFSGLFQVGVGYRVLDESNVPSTVLLNPSPGSAEFVLGAGLWIPVGSRVRLVPRLDATFGSFSGAVDASGNSASLGYAMLTFGVSGYFNVNLR